MRSFLDSLSYSPIEMRTKKTAIYTGVSLSNSLNFMVGLGDFADLLCSIMIALFITASSKTILIYHIYKKSQNE